MERGMSEDRDWSEYARKRRVFVLGAGFSASAGIPLTATLLKAAMEMLAAECPGIFQRVSNYALDIQWERTDHPDFSTIGFSDLCTHLEFVELREYAGGERWSDAGSREKLTLRYYLAKTLVRTTPTGDKIPDLYIKFANQLTDGDIVITFNWDILLELAILKVGKSFTYNFKGPGVKLSKPHGSVNWRLGKPTRLGKEINTLDWKPIGLADGGMISVDLYASHNLALLETWNRYQPLGELQPFLVLPGYGKAFDVRSIATLWYRPEFTFAACRDIYIIGLGLSPDDHFVRSFFLNNFPMPDRKTFIVNPDEQAGKNYAFMLRDKDVTLIQEKFSTNHVRLILDRLDQE
jgi:hypothetical protein